MSDQNKVPVLKANIQLSHLSYMNTHVTGQNLNDSPKENFSTTKIVYLKILSVISVQDHQKQLREGRYSLVYTSLEN